MQEFNFKEHLEGQTKEQILEFLVKWCNYDQNPNYEEIKNTWTKAQLINCILIDQEIQERLQKV